MPTFLPSGALVDTVISCPRAKRGITPTVMECLMTNGFRGLLTLTWDKPGGSLELESSPEVSVEAVSQANFSLWPILFSSLPSLP